MNRLFVFSITGMDDFFHFPIIYYYEFGNIYYHMVDIQSLRLLIFFYDRLQSFFSFSTEKFKSMIPAFQRSVEKYILF